MSSLPSVEPFEGTGTWEECNNFIRAIRAAAWKEGKLRDTNWIADFASLHFSYKALLWHSQLPEDVRQDWSKLETSILTRWAPSEDDNRAKIQPIPAAAPSQNLSSRPNLPAQGFIKIADNSNKKYYLEFSHSLGILTPTTTAKNACRVLCSPLLSFGVLEPIVNSRHSWLALHFFATSPTLGKGSNDYTYIVRQYSDNSKSSASYSGPLQPLRCVVSPNLEVTPVWGKEDGSTITLFPFICGGLIRVVVDAEVYSKTHSNEPRAKLFIEPIDEA